MSTKPTLRSALVMLHGRFAADERAATSIEYAIMASGIAVAIAAVVFNLGTELNTMYQSVSTAFK